jgi:hypothetical protein
MSGRQSKRLPQSSGNVPEADGFGTASEPPSSALFLPPRNETLSTAFRHAPNVSGLIRQARLVVSTVARILWLSACEATPGQTGSITTSWQEFVLALNSWVAFCQECKIRTSNLAFAFGQIGRRLEDF